jgi:phasin
MVEVTTAPAPKAKPVKAAVEAPKVETLKFEAPKFEIPKFEIPKFDIPSMEVPAALREFAEKGIAQAKDGYEKLKAVAEDTTGILEDTYATASKGAADYGLKVIEHAKTNSATAFDFVGKLMTAKSVSEFVELSSAHARSQFETATAQAKELQALAQKVATDTAEPIKSGFSAVVSKAA